jgi:hypothetical protein
MGLGTSPSHHVPACGCGMDGREARSLSTGADRFPNQEMPTAGGVEA